MKGKIDFFQKCVAFLPCQPGMRMRSSEGVVMPQFFICWITLHFKEFQSAAIGKRIELVPKCTNSLFLPQSNFLFPTSNVISGA